MSKRRKHLDVNEPLRHADHPRPSTRREFIRQGFLGGSAYVLGGSVFSLFANPNQAMAGVSADLNDLAANMKQKTCNLTAAAGSMIPFICFDLAGGANLAGSNVLVGKAGRQDQLLSTAGYNKLGLPGNMIPGLSSAALTTGFSGTVLNPSATNNFVNDSLGLWFHQDSAMLFGILEKFPNPTGVDGVVIPALSDNDTGNNPHNPMYLLAKAGINGDVVRLIGSQNSDSGGNSMSPAAYMNPEFRPTKVDRPSDVTGMVDVGDLTAVLSDPADVTAVMESMARISHKKIRLNVGRTNPGIDVKRDEVIKDLLECGYLKSADLANRFAGKSIDPSEDIAIVGPTGIFVSETTQIGTTGKYTFSDSEFAKTASVMKMVIDGHAGAGCITMGGFDYHTGDRSTGENRDLRAGRCIGACLEYARRSGKPVMIYVFSDGSLNSNGRIDTSANSGNSLGGRGKGEWTGDNSSTACSYFLVYNPNGSSNIILPAFDGRQIGSFSADGDVMASSSPAANNVNLLVNTVVANYLKLNNMSLDTFVPSHGLGNLANVVAVGNI